MQALGRGCRGRGASPPGRRGALDDSVHRVMREVEEPRTVAMVRDEVDRLVREIVDVLVAFVLGAGPGRRAEVEAVVCRAACGLEGDVTAVGVGREMPLAGGARGVAGGRRPLARVNVSRDRFSRNAGSRSRPWGVPYHGMTCHMPCGPCAGR